MRNILARYNPSASQRILSSRIGTRARERQVCHLLNADTRAGPTTGPQGRVADRAGRYPQTDTPNVGSICSSWMGRYGDFGKTKMCSSVALLRRAPPDSGIARCSAYVGHDRRPRLGSAMRATRSSVRRKSFSAGRPRDLGTVASSCRRKGQPSPTTTSRCSTGAAWDRCDRLDTERPHPRDTIDQVSAQSLKIVATLRSR